MKEFLTQRRSGAEFELTVLLCAVAPLREKNS
jgi:hypothetical protein